MKTKSYFILRRNKNNCTIFVQIYIAGDRILFSTNISVDEYKFDIISGKVLSKDINYRDKNIILDNITSRINDVFVKYRLRDMKLTKDAFLKAYNRPSDHNNFYKYADDYIKRTRITIEDSTVQVHRRVLKLLENYKQDLQFEEITQEFVECYFHYMRKKLKLGDSYAYKNLSVIKKYVRAAVREGYMDIDPFVTFKIKKVKSTSFVYLEREELETLMSYYNDKNISQEHKRVLHIFLWMCFGSQHISDARNTKIEDVNGGYLHYYRTKLRNSKPQLLKIPLCTPLEQLYNDAKGSRTKDLLFNNLPSNQKINMHLKTIAKVAGIDKTITCKSGRHTFATYFLAKTQQLATLQELMGHSNISETLIYAHVIDESKENGIKCFNELI